MTTSDTERHWEARLVGTDPETDLALLRVIAPKGALTPIRLSQDAKLAVGQTVLAIGNPFGVGQTVTSGIISALGRHGLGLNIYEDFIQTDAAINSGNSGGGLFDLHLHDIDYLCYLFGRVKQVYAVGRKNDVGCWNHVASSLTFENGVQATAEGIIEMPKGFPFTMELNVVGDEKAVCYRMRAGANLEDVASAIRETWLYGGEEPEKLKIEPYDAYQKELEHFIGHIDAGTPITAITPQDVRHVLTVIHAIRTSLETGMTVAL